EDQPRSVGREVEVPNPTALERLLGRQGRRVQDRHSARDDGRGEKSVLHKLVRRTLACRDVPFIDLPSSPLAPGASPVHIYYRDEGDGPPIVFLHGGWGHEIYPFDRQLDAFGSRHRVVIPDRSGYGR